jgi:arsenate reductase
MSAWIGVCTRAIDTLRLAFTLFVFPRSESLKMALVLYHNPRCSKSRAALALLQERGYQPEVFEYLKQPPSPRELRAILKKLGCSAHELVRATDKKFQQLGLGPITELGEEKLTELMCEHPQLIQRPILINNDRARLGRPPEAVLEIAG